MARVAVRRGRGGVRIELECVNDEEDGWRKMEEMMCAPQLWPTRKSRVGSYAVPLSGSSSTPAVKFASVSVLGRGTPMRKVRARRMSCACCGCWT